MQIFLIIFAVVLAVTMWGRGRFTRIYAEEFKNMMKSGITGAELARRILKVKGIDDVEIVMGRGLFADYYNPQKKRLSLATRHFKGSTFSALGMAAHEAGHVLQHRAGHRPLFWRLSAVRATMTLGLPIALLAVVAILLPGGRQILPVLLLIWSAIAGFNLFTMPIELDATERAKDVLSKLKPFRNLDERLGVERVMNVAGANYIDGIFTVLSWVGSLVTPWWKKQTQPEESDER